MGARGRRLRGLRRAFPHLCGDAGHRSPHPGRRLRPGLPAATGGAAAGTPAPRAEDRPPARPTVSESPHAEGGEAGGDAEAGGAEEAGGRGDPLLGELRQLLGDAILEGDEGGADGAGPAAAGAADISEGAGGAVTVLVRREEVARVAAALRSRFRYTQLVDLCAADYPERPLRFEVVYHLYSFRENRRIRLLVRTDEGSPVPSVTGVWRAA